MANQSATFWEDLQRDIDHLHAGDSLELTDVTWSDYEHLLDQLDARPALRVSYDRGRLEIVTTTPLHEMDSDLLLLIAFTTANRLGLRFESRGHTTLKVEKFRQGAEPDTCFYVGNAHRLRGNPRRLLDFTIDPPPDILVEVDITHDSKRKLSFYRNIGVPELWVYDEKRLRILVLEAAGYEEARVSRSFPILTSELLSQTLEIANSENSQTAALQYLQRQLG